jgi:predicted deacylase
MKNADVRRYAKAFGTSIVVDDKGVKGMLRRAATHAGIPFIAFEGGTSNTFQKPIVRAGVQGILSFLQRSGMLKKKRKLRRSPFKIVVHRTEWIRAERGGLLELRTHPGRLVYKGDPVAKVSNPWGRDVHIVPSPVTGLVIGVTTSPVVNPGTAIANVAQLRKTLSTVERSLVAGTLKSEEI